MKMMKIFAVDKTHFSDDKLMCNTFIALYSIIAATRVSVNTSRFSLSRQL